MSGRRLPRPSLLHHRPRTLLCEPARHPPAESRLHRLKSAGRYRRKACQKYRRDKKYLPPR